MKEGMWEQRYVPAETDDERIERERREADSRELQELLDRINELLDAEADPLEIEAELKAAGELLKKTHPKSGDSSDHDRFAAALRFAKARLEELKKARTRAAEEKKPKREPPQTDLEKRRAEEAAAARDKRAEKTNIDRIVTRRMERDAHEHGGREKPPKT
jgi:hypothetical protein